MSRNRAEWVWYNVILAGIMMPVWAIGFLAGFFWAPLVTGFVRGRDM